MLLMVVRSPCGCGPALGTRQILRERRPPAIPGIGDRANDGSLDLWRRPPHAGCGRRGTSHARASAADRRNVRSPTSTRTRDAGRTAARVTSPASGPRRPRHRECHFTNREEEPRKSNVDNPRTMKTTEICKRPRCSGPTVTRRTRRGVLPPPVRADRRRALAARRVAVEFALIAPVLVLLTFGVIEFSRGAPRQVDRRRHGALRRPRRFGQGNAGRLRLRRRLGHEQRRVDAARHRPPGAVDQRELAGLPGRRGRLLVVLHEVHGVLRTAPRRRHSCNPAAGLQPHNQQVPRRGTRSDRRLREARPQVRDQALRGGRRASPSARYPVRAG